MCASRLHVPTCTAQVACDGENLAKARIESGICGKCAEALAKKNKAPKPLRGVNTAIPKYIREKE